MEMKKKTVANFGDTPGVTKENREEIMKKSWFQVFLEISNWIYFEKISVKQSAKNYKKCIWINFGQFILNTFFKKKGISYIFLVETYLITDSK